MAEWRVGRSQLRTLYRDDVLVGMVDTPEIAAEIVEALNRYDQTDGPGPHTAGTTEQLPMAGRDFDIDGQTWGADQGAEVGSNG